MNNNALYNFANVILSVFCLCVIIILWGQEQCLFFKMYFKYALEFSVPWCWYPHQEELVSEGRHPSVHSCQHLGSGIGEQTRIKEASWNYKGRVEQEVESKLRSFKNIEGQVREIEVSEQVSRGRTRNKTKKRGNSRVKSWLELEPSRSRGRIWNTSGCCDHSSLCKVFLSLRTLKLGWTLHAPQDFFLPCKSSVACRPNSDGGTSLQAEEGGKGPVYEFGEREKEHETLPKRPKRVSVSLLFHL